MGEPARTPVWALVLMHAIPAVGTVFFGWSIALVLLFYWLENVVNGVVWTQAIRRHHDLTRMRGHYRNQLGVSANNQKIEFFPDEYRAGALVFTAVHGLFILLFVFVLLDGRELLADLWWVLLLLGSSVFLTLQELRPVVANIEQRSFAWLRTQARRSLYPVHAMHVGIILGGVTIARDDSGQLLVLLLIGLRILADVARQRPEQPLKNRKPLGANLFGGMIKVQVGDQRVDWFEHQQRLLAEDELPKEPEPDAPKTHA